MMEDMIEDMMEESKKKKRLLIVMVIFLSFFGSYELIGQEEVEDEEDLEEVFDEAVNESAEGGIEDFEDGDIEEDNENEGVEKVLVEDRKIKIGSEVDSRTVITREEIEKSGAKNVPELLQKQPGVYVQPPHADSWPGNGAFAIRMRGRGGTQTLVLIDGIPTNRDWEGNSISLSSLPLGGIERIEILRGNQTVLYGSGSFGGVINIITRRGEKSKKETKLLGHGYVGSSKKLDLGIGLLNQSKDYSFSFYMNYLGRQAIQYPTKDGDQEIKQTRDIDNYKKINVLANVNMVLSESATASLTANHKESDLDYSNKLTNGVTYNDSRNRTTLLGTSIQYAISEFYKPEVQLNYKTHTISKWESEAGKKYSSNQKYAHFNRNLTNFNAKLLNHFYFFKGTNRLTLGFEYKLHHMQYFAKRERTFRLSRVTSSRRRSSSRVTSSRRRSSSRVSSSRRRSSSAQKRPSVKNPLSFQRSRNIKSIILSDLWNPLEGLTAELTGKFHFLDSNYGFSDKGGHFKAGVGYNLVDDSSASFSLLKFRTSASYGQYTLVHGRYYSMHSSRSTFSGQNDLRPEKGLSWEAGMDVSFFQDRVGLFGTYYMYNIKDKIIYLHSPADDPDPRGHIPINIDKAKSAGFEVEFSTQIPFGFTLKTSYNHTQTDYYKKEDQKYIEEEYRDPKHRVNIYLNWNYFEPLSLSFNWRAESESLKAGLKLQKDKEKYEIKGHNVLDINGSLQIIKELRLVGGLYNVLNKVYRTSQHGRYGQKMNFFVGLHFNLEI